MDFKCQVALFSILFSPDLLNHMSLYLLLWSIMLCWVFELEILKILLELKRKRKVSNIFLWSFCKLVPHPRFE